MNYEHCTSIPEDTLSQTIEAARVGDVEAQVWLQTLAPDIDWSTEVVDEDMVIAVANDQYLRVISVPFFM